MIVTLPYLREKFRAFNAMCFNGCLPEPRLRVGKARTMLGNLRYKKEKGWLGTTRYTDLTLSVSTYYDLSQEDLDDTILHEMIHLYIICSHKRDDSAHGPLFRKIMNEINRRFGRHITVSHRGELQKSDTGKCQNIIAVSVFRDGTTCITRAALTKVFLLHREIPRFPEIESVAWYHSRNPYFDTFPRALTPKFYKVGKDILDRELSGALPLKIENGKVSVL